jgi:hypothetical protein
VQRYDAEGKKDEAEGSRKTLNEQSMQEKKG